MKDDKPIEKSALPPLTCDCCGKPTLTRVQVIVRYCPDCVDRTKAPTVMDIYSQTEVKNDGR